MAKKQTAKRVRSSSREQYEDLPSMESEYRSSSRRGRSSALSARGTEHDYMGIVRELISNPTVKYVAGGIATALLTRLATNLSDRYPEISKFITENLDTVESKLSGGRFTDSESAPH